MKNFLKKLGIIGILIIIVTAISVFFYTQKTENNQQLGREFELSGAKVSFVQPRGWECVQIENLKKWKEYNGRIICGEEIDGEIVEYIVNNYNRAKGNSVRSKGALFVENEYGEFIIFREMSQELPWGKTDLNIKNDQFFTSVLWDTRIDSFGQNTYRSFQYKNSRLNVFGVLKVASSGNLDIINILPEGQKSEWNPSEKVKKILETLQVKEISENK